MGGLFSVSKDDEFFQHLDDVTTFTMQWSLVPKDERITNAWSKMHGHWRRWLAGRPLVMMPVTTLPRGSKNCKIWQRFCNSLATLPSALIRTLAGNDDAQQCFCELWFCAVQSGANLYSYAFVFAPWNFFSVGEIDTITRRVPDVMAVRLRSHDICVAGMLAATQVFRAVLRPDLATNDASLDLVFGLSWCQSVEFFAEVECFTQNTFRWPSAVQAPLHMATAAIIIARFKTAATLWAARSTWIMTCVN